MSNVEKTVYYMERDGAVKIPEKFDKMTYSEISAECARLAQAKGNKKPVQKKKKVPCKTKFAI